MKQITVKLVMLSILFSTGIYAQELNNTPTKHHELSFDLLELFSLKKFEISYDYLINKSNSIGANKTIGSFGNHKNFKITLLSI